jgi:hypothetical protein
MWSVAKVMLKIAQNAVGEGKELDAWEDFLKSERVNEADLIRMMERHIGFEWDRWGNWEL